MRDQRPGGVSDGRCALRCGEGEVPLGARRDGRQGGRGQDTALARGAMDGCRSPLPRPGPGGPGPPRTALAPPRCCRLRTLPHGSIIGAAGASQPASITSMMLERGTRRSAVACTRSQDFASVPSPDARQRAAWRGRRSCSRAARGPAAASGRQRFERRVRRSRGAAGATCGSSFEGEGCGLPNKRSKFSVVWLSHRPLGGDDTLMVETIGFRDASG